MDTFDPDAIINGGWIVLIVCFIVVTDILIGLVAAEKHFMKNASLPSFLSPGLVLYMSTFGFLFHPVAINVSFNLMGYVLTCKLSSDELRKLVIPIVLAVFITIVWMAVHVTVMSSSMTFRPVSFMTTASQPSDLFFVIQAFIVAVMGLGTHLSRSGSIITYAIAVILYCCSMAIPWLLSGFVSLHISGMFAAAVTSGIVYTIIQVVLMIMDKQGTLIL